MIKAYRKAGGLAVVAAAAVFGLAACGGSGSGGGHVASLNGSSGNHADTTTTTLPKGNPTQLLDEWTNCMRSHGDPNQVDPTIDANKDIHITFPPTYNNNGPVGIGGGNSSNDPCAAYLTAASTALRGGKPLQKPDQAKLEKFSQCMRANGIPDFPDPNGNGLSIQTSPGSDLNPHNPTFQHASQLCAKRTGVQGFGGNPGPGAIEATQTGGPQGGPGGNGGSKTNSVSAGG